MSNRTSSARFTATRQSSKRPMRRLIGAILIEIAIGSKDRLSKNAPSKPASHQSSRAACVDSLNHSEHSYRQLRCK
jgi:hypothetical protein